MCFLYGILGFIAGAALSAFVAKWLMQWRDKLDF